MLNFPGYPTPPSANEDSPVSYTTLSPASYTPESSLSPGIIQASQVVILPSNLTILPFPMSDQLTDAQPYLEITEEPIDKFRFRYKSEMTGTHGCLNGEKSDKSRKMTYPTVKLHNYNGTAIIRCSIWQKNHNGNDCMPHAHRLVKKRHNKEEADDPHEITVNESTDYEASFSMMGIIHTAKKNIVPELIKKKTALMLEINRRSNRQNLSKKEEMEIKGLAEAESKSIDLNVVCLRFDAFHVVENVRFPICSAAFSHHINNLKSALTGELKIVRMDHCTSPASGGREIFLLVERVTKKNIRVRFYELDEDDNLKWEDFGKFNDLDVHHQYAIVLRTPPYMDRNITRPVNVFMELVRPTDNAKSEPKDFTYTPASNYGKPGAKRFRPNDFDSSDYDTASSVGSAGLPRTIQNMSSSLSSVKLAEVDSSEIDRMLHDYNSNEFDEMFQQNRPGYELLFSSNFSFDSPGIRNQKRNSLSSNTKYQNDNYKKKVIRAVSEITEYLRTRPTDRKEIVKHIQRYVFDFSDDYNAFHMAVIIGDVRAIQLFTKLVAQYEQLDMVNIPTKSGQGTALHIAVVCGDKELVQCLINCQADISAVDNNMNTPLHLASEDATGNMATLLMEAANAASQINKKNKNGNSPLHIAVKGGNLEVVKVLCRCGADVNCLQQNNGYTPLRCAVDGNDVEIIKYLLYGANADPRIPDFNGINPMQVVQTVEHSKEVVDILNKYSEENQISSENFEIKMEPEDEESEDEKEIFEEDVKAEPLPIGDEYHNIFQNLDHFTDECLDEISAEIDSSGKWQDLTELLNLEHLLRVDTISEKSPGRRILSIATQVATVKEIRGFLEALDETKAVQAIDRMALAMYNKLMSSSGVTENNDNR